MLTAGTIQALIFIPLGVIVLITGTCFGVAAVRHKPRSDYDDFRVWTWLVGGFCLLAGLLMLVLPLVGLSLVGFNGDYMAYKPISGQVQDIASRQIADGKAMSTRYVLMIDGQPYGVDDTRAALVKEGDTVNLNCTKEFVWGSTNNGYACNWG